MQSPQPKTRALSEKDSTKPRTNPQPTCFFFYNLTCRIGPDTIPTCQPLPSYCPHVGWYSIQAYLGGLSKQPMEKQQPRSSDFGVASAAMVRRGNRHNPRCHAMPVLYGPYGQVFAMETELQHGKQLAFVYAFILALVIIVVLIYINSCHAA